MESQSTPLAVAGRPAARRVTTRPAPQKTTEHAHLTLDALRAYRKALAAEEGRVSYWRRIIQARLDVVRTGTAVDGSHLRGILSSARVSAGRSALVEVLPADDIPPLPDLAALWEREVEGDSPTSQLALIAELAVAELQLSEFRAALHLRIGAATAELIARYHEQPSLCLTALPLPPLRRPAMTRSE